MIKTARPRQVAFLLHSTYDDTWGNSQFLGKAPNGRFILIECCQLYFRSLGDEKGACPLIRLDFCLIWKTIRQAFQKQHPLAVKQHMGYLRVYRLGAQIKEKYIRFTLGSDR